MGQHALDTGEVCQVFVHKVDDIVLHEVDKEASGPERGKEWRNRVQVRPAEVVVVLRSSVHIHLEDELYAPHIRRVQRWSREAGLVVDIAGLHEGVDFPPPAESETECGRAQVRTFDQVVEGLEYEAVGEVEGYIGSYRLVDDGEGEVWEVEETLGCGSGCFGWVETVPWVRERMTGQVVRCWCEAVVSC